MLLARTTTFLPVLFVLQAFGQECRTRLDSADSFTNERFVIVDGPRHGPYPWYTFLMEDRRLYKRVLWRSEGQEDLVALQGDLLLLKLGNGRVLNLFVDQNETSLPTRSTSGPARMEIGFDVPVTRADVEALGAHWVERLRMQFTTGGTHDIDTGSMNVWPMDLSHTARCFLQHVPE